MATTARPQDLYDELRTSHEIQRALCTSLTRSRTAESRRTTLRELDVELAAHAAAEERFLYAPMLMDDAGLSSSRHALAEHHEMEELVEQLRGIDPDADAWLDTAKELAHEVRHHLKEEERAFFQISGKILTDRQKATLAGRYRRDYERMKRKLAG
jgi:hypothetical protein